jgi:hypothetical protein
VPNGAYLIPSNLRELISEFWTCPQPPKNGTVSLLFYLLFRTTDELGHLANFGFRGEVLPSIL